MSTNWWTDREWARREQVALWQRSWLLAAHGSRLAQPGDFVVFDVGCDSALVVRDEHGGVRAFVNSCPHRGTRLSDGVGCAPRIRCPYHGFTYALDGSLLAAPHLERKPELTLYEIACAERFGFVWICFAQPSASIDDHLAPVADELEARALGSWSLSGELTTQLRCNWKVSADVHGEALHVPSLHPELKEAVDWRHARVTRLRPHARIDVEARIAAIGHNVLLYVFPNAHFNLHPDEAVIFRHRPGADDPGVCQFDQITLVRRGHDHAAAPRRASLDDPAFGSITEADLRIAERVQRGLASTPFREPAFTEHEQLLAWMLAEIRARVE